MIEFFSIFDKNSGHISIISLKKFNNFEKLKFSQFSKNNLYLQICILGLEKCFEKGGIHFKKIEIKNSRPSATSCGIFSKFEKYYESV